MDLLSRRLLALKIYWEINSPQTSSGTHINDLLLKILEKMIFGSFDRSNKYLTHPAKFCLHKGKITPWMECCSISGLKLPNISHPRIPQTIRCSIALSMMFGLTCYFSLFLLFLCNPSLVPTELTISNWTQHATDKKVEWFDFPSYTASSQEPLPCRIDSRKDDFSITTV